MIFKPRYIFIAQICERRNNSRTTMLVFSTVPDKLLMSKVQLHDSPNNRADFRRHLFFYNVCLCCFIIMIQFEDCLQYPLRIIYYVIAFLCCFAMLPQQGATQKAERYTAKSKCLYLFVCFVLICFSMQHKCY